MEQKHKILESLGVIKIYFERISAYFDTSARNDQFRAKNQSKK